MAIGCLRLLIMLRLAKDKKKRGSATALTPSQTTEVEEAGAVTSDPSSDGKGSERMDDDGIRYRRGNAVPNDQGSVLRGAESSAKAEYEYKTRGGVSVRGL